MESKAINKNYIAKEGDSSEACTTKNIADLSERQGTEGINSNLFSLIESYDEQSEILRQQLEVNLSKAKSLQGLVEANLSQGKSIQGLIEVTSKQDDSLKSIAQPHIADWIGAGANVTLSLLAVYAAFKVKNVFDDRLDSKVYAEVESFWDACDEIVQDIKMYELLFPFKLLEPVDEWDENEEVKKKVESFLSFSDDQSEKMKKLLHKLKDIDRNVHRLGWRIHPKASDDFKSLYDAIERMYRSLGEYNCLTAQLFRIDKQYIGTTMFLGFENLEWSDRYSVVDRNLPGHIDSVNTLRIEIITHINNLECLSAKRKFVSKS